MPVTRQASRVFYGWDGLQGDELAVTLGSLDLFDLINANLVCTVWCAAGQQDSVWELLTKRQYKPSNFKAAYSSFALLGELTWMAKYKLLHRRKTPPLINYRAINAASQETLENEYEFIISVADAHRQAASATGLPCKEFFRGYLTGTFNLEAHFDVPAAMFAGVEADWLTEEGAYADEVPGFGSLSIDVYVRRACDKKVAHLLAIDFDIENPFPSDGVTVWRPKDASASDDFHISLDNWSVIPPWLGEHVDMAYPNLSWGRSDGKRGSTWYNATTTNVKGTLMWPPTREGSHEPEWVVGLDATVQAPDPDSLGEDEADNPKTGKLTGVRLEFKWCNPPFCQGEHQPVEKPFMVQALAGNAIQWA